tara:strand:+ start:404 stop:583 length:180 start_codon:yes stop_codon:yes gene_type:complete
MYAIDLLFLCIFIVTYICLFLGMITFLNNNRSINKKEPGLNVKCVIHKDEFTGDYGQYK